MAESQPSPERWLPVVGYEGLYEISDHGRVRSLDRLVKRSSTSTRIEKGRIMQPGSGKRTGHKHVNLSADGKRCTRKVHRLMVEAFIGPIPEGMQVLHLNDIADDNRLTNLRVGDFSDNAYDKVRNGRHHNARKTHCPKGHEYTRENTRVIPSRPTARYCKACGSARRRRAE